MVARDQWREHIDQWMTSGLTAAQYGERAGVNPRTLTYWKWRLGRELRGEGSPPKAAVAALVEFRAPEDTCMELVLSDGRRVRVPTSFDATALRRLIDVLEGPS
jgi:hypothetical protein